MINKKKFLFLHLLTLLGLFGFTYNVEATSESSVYYEKSTGWLVHVELEDTDLNTTPSPEELEEMQAEMRKDPRQYDQLAAAFDASSPYRSKDNPYRTPAERIDGMRNLLIEDRVKLLSILEKFDYHYYEAVAIYNRMNDGLPYTNEDSRLFRYHYDLSNEYSSQFEQAKKEAFEAWRKIYPWTH
ncbi:hypothetical protein ACVRYP_04210 [Streptococcus rifensis]